MDRCQPRVNPTTVFSGGVPLLLALVSWGCSPIYRKVGGSFTGGPEELEARLSAGARRLVDWALADLEPGSIVDFHVHLAGNGSSSGIEVHPSWFGSWNPLVRARARVFMSAAGVSDLSEADETYLRRLIALLCGFPRPARAVLYALDRHHTADGLPDPDRTPIHVPSERVVEVARAHPDLFVPAVSVHPYRKDAVEEIDRWGKDGCRFVKWLPNSMGIDPSDPRCDPFYEAMRRHDMVLLSHTGRELAVDAKDQRLGNPLLLRRPLDHGLKVVALHCAADGKDVDLDDPARPQVPSFDLFLRLMDEPRYRGLLFGEISAIAFYHRLGRPLDTLLERADLHGRLLQGSDYPLPGINFLTRTRLLARRGYLSWEERAALDEIYGLNPLLFDLVLKRTIHHPRTGARFPATMFSAPEALRAALGSG